MVSIKELITEAMKIAKKKKLTDQCTIGEVSSALITDKNKIYSGLSINASCSLGFCAEHSAITTMISKGKSRIKKIVAVHYDGKILPPYGKCRELIIEINDDNKDTEVIIDKERTVKLDRLLPQKCQEKFR